MIISTFDISSWLQVGNNVLILCMPHIHSIELCPWKIFLDIVRYLIKKYSA